MKSISDMNLAEVTLAILGASVNIPDGMYSRAQYLAKEELRALLDKPDECRCKRYGKDNPHWPCPVHAEPAAQHQGGVTLEQVLKAYDYANSHPHKYLRGTTNWCAAVAHALNVQQPAPVAVVIDIESAAKKIAERMDYPWECMPEQGRNSMRENAKAIVDAAMLNGVKP